MTIDTLPQANAFRTRVIKGLPDTAKVNRKSNTIFGAKAIELGPLNEGDMRTWKVDNITLKQLTDAVNHSSGGVKMRFAHPNMSRDGMGRRLGKAVNARIIEEVDTAYVAIDAKLSDSARRSPSGNLTDHVLDLAEDSPEDFGLSIAPILDREAMDNMEPDKNGLTPIRIKGLRAIDFVDEPAATRGGLFSIDGSSAADLPAQATWLLDTYFGNAEPSVVEARFREFLATYFCTKGVTMPEGNKKATDTTPTVDEQLAEKDKQIAELQARLKQNESAEEQEALASELGPKEAAKKELQRRAEISALCSLAKVDEPTRDLMFDAGFSRSEAQDYLKSSGLLSIQNPPVGEQGGQKEPQSPEDKYKEEFAKDAAVFAQMGVSEEEYVASRKLDKELAS